MATRIYFKLLIESYDAFSINPNLTHSSTKYIMINARKLAVGIDV